MTARELTLQLAAQAPGGWTTEVGDREHHDGFETYEHEDGAWVRFAKVDEDLAVGIVLNIGPADAYSKPFVDDLMVEGHTTFNGCSFTRRGVDSYSCLLVPTVDGLPAGRVYTTVAGLLAGEAARCAEAAARRKTLVQVPGTNFKRQPDWFAKSAAALKAGKCVSLTPAGFGTGIEIRKGSPRRFERRATPELEKAIGVSPLILSDIDCD